MSSTETHVGPPARSTDDLIDVRVLLRILLQQRAIIGLAVLFSLALSTTYCLLATKIYDATAVVEVFSRRAEVMGDSGSGDVLGGATQSSALNTHFHKMTGAEVRGEVAQAVRHGGSIYPQVRDLSIPELEYYIQNCVEFELILGTHLVGICASTESKEFSQYLANTYAEVVVENVKAFTKRATSEAVSWLEEHG